MENESHTNELSKIPLFVDIDGVFNTVGTHGILEEPLNNFNCFLEGVKDKVCIVISSSWRIDSMDKLKLEAGPLISSLIVGSTPVINKDFVPGNRSLEINMYLKDTNYVGEYFIVDDMNVWFNESHLGKKELYLVNNSIGFTKQDGVNLTHLIASVS